MPDNAFSLRNILDKDTPDFTIRVESDPAGMEARAFIFPKKTSRITSHENISLMLREAGIVHGLDQNAIKLAHSVAAAGTEQRGVVLAKATLPAHGHDEYVKFLIMPNSDRHKFELIEKDRLAGEALPLLVNVKPGDEIGRVEANTGGQPGMNIFGLPIPGKDGVMMAGYPQAGDGVSWDHLAKAYYATTAGRIIFERNIISVSDKYLLIGDVTKRTGSINFLGDIEITGNVSDGHTVKARSIKLGGRAGDCTLEAETDIVINSMNGNYAGTIHCGGNLSADSLTNCFVEVRGDLLVRGGLSRCVVKCGGAIIAKTARIEGGSCIAFKGIDVLNLGSPRDSRTVVCAGRCHFTEQRLHRLHKELGRKSRKLHRIQRMIAPYVYDRSKLAKLRPEHRHSYDKMYQEFKSLAQDISDLRSNIDELRDYQSQNAAAVINVRGMLMRGVIITLDSTTQEIGMAVRSPATIVENQTSRLLDFQKLRPLPIEVKSMKLNDTEQANIIAPDKES